MTLWPQRIVRTAFDVVGHSCLMAGRFFHSTGQEKNITRWYADGAEHKLRLDYDLTSDSIVLDLGGYKGQWASDIFSRFGCTVHVFEPMPEFSDFIQWRFVYNPAIRVHPFALMDVNKEMELSTAGDGSSMFRRTKSPLIRIKVRRASDVFVELEIERIDLMKINIEGAEYDLLEHLISSGWVSKIRDLQVQFHDFVPNAKQRMTSIEASLSESHRLTYRYPYIWENWRLKD